MFHVEKIMFHATDGFFREIFDKFNAGSAPGKPVMQISL